MSRLRPLLIAVGDPTDPDHSTDTCGHCGRPVTVDPTDRARCDAVGCWPCVTASHGVRIRT